VRFSQAKLKAKFKSALPGVEIKQLSLYTVPIRGIFKGILAAAKLPRILGARASALRLIFAPMNESERTTDHQPNRSFADHVRDISLRELLRCHGFEIKPEGVTFRAKNDSHNIVVTGNRWFDNKAGLGGLGAIDLQMHLTGEDFAAAYQTLARDFRGLSTAEIGLSFPIERHIRSEQERRPFHELAARYVCRRKRTGRLPAPISSKHAGSTPPSWTICTRWERSSPTTIAQIRASFSSTGRSTERSKERLCETQGSNPHFVRASETSSPPGSPSGISTKLNRYCGRISHRRPELSHDPCLSRRCLGGRELCGSDGSQRTDEPGIRPPPVLRSRP